MVGWESRGGDKDGLCTGQKFMFYLVEEYIANGSPCDFLSLTNLAHRRKGDNELVVFNFGNKNQTKKNQNELGITVERRMCWCHAFM